MKKGVNNIENQRENSHKLLQKCQFISGTKCDRDKPIVSAEIEGQ